MNRVMLSVILLVLSVLVLNGCFDSKTRDSDSYDNDNYTNSDLTTQPPDLAPFEPPQKNTIVGQVVSSTGSPIEGVKVSFGTEFEAITNYDGMYFIDQLSPSDRIILKFEHPSFATITKTGSMFQDGLCTVNAVLQPKAPARSLLADQQADLDFPMGKLVVPASAFTDSQGNPASGQVMVRMTPVDVTTNQILASPGDFSAVTGDGADAQLETFGMAEFEATDSDGQKLSIADGKAVTVEMLLPADTALLPGDVLPAWHFDETQGKWVEEGQGTVQQSTQDSSRLAFVVDVSHFSWWNCDQEMETSCVSGTIKYCDGSIAAGADVMSSSSEYDGTSTAFSTPSGTYCLPVKRGAPVTITAAAGYGQERLASSTTVTAPEDPSSCPGPCATADITLPCTPQESDIDCDDTWFVGCKSCAKGRVVTEDGNAVPWAVIDVSTGNTGFRVLADANGQYCAPAALGSLTTISANSGTQSGMVTVMASDTGTCPNCMAAPDIVVSGSNADFNISTTECVDEVGGVVINSVLANATHPNLTKLDSGWGYVLRSESDAEGTPQKYWDLELIFVSSEFDGRFYGAPFGVLHMHIETPITSPETFELKTGDNDGWSFSGRLSAALGNVIGLGNETFVLADLPSDDSGLTYQTGTVRFLNGFDNVGDQVQGEFELVFAPDCARRGASIVLKGTFNLPVRSPMSIWDITGMDNNVDPTVYINCSMASLMAWAQDLSQVYQGAVDLRIDGNPVGASDSAPFGSAHYSYDSDSLWISMYADEYVAITVNSPKPGANTNINASLNIGDCFYSGNGVVDIMPFTDPETDSWLNGTFDIDFPPLDGSACPQRQVTGQFGAAVCRQ